MHLTTALALEDDPRLYPYMLGYPEKGEHTPEDGIVAFQQVQVMDDQHLVLVEGPVEIA